MIIPNIWENRKCSKPPTRYGLGIPHFCGSLHLLQERDIGSRRWHGSAHGRGKPLPISWKVFGEQWDLKELSTTIYIYICDICVYMYIYIHTYTYTYIKLVGILREYDNLLDQPTIFYCMSTVLCN